MDEALLTRQIWKRGSCAVLCVVISLLYSVCWNNQPELFVHAYGNVSDTSGTALAQVLVEFDVRRLADVNEPWPFGGGMMISDTTDVVGNYRTSKVWIYETDTYVFSGRVAKSEVVAKRVVKITKGDLDAGFLKLKIDITTHLPDSLLPSN